MSNEKKIRIVIADDHALVRVGVEEGLRNYPNIEVVAAVDTGLLAIDAYKAHCPDVLLLDYRMPGMNGDDVVKEVIAHDPRARVLIVSAFDGEDDIWRATQAGAQGYITKGADVDEIARALVLIANEMKYFPSDIQAKLSVRKERKELTKRESEVIGYLAQGMSNAEIKEKMGLAMPTVRLHVSNVLSKLQAADRTEAVVKSIHRGIVHMDS